MADMQEAVKDQQPERVVEEREGMITENNPNQGNSPSNPSQSSDNMAWVGALKKEFRQKGYDEGYQKAKEELQAALQEPVNTSQPNGQLSSSPPMPVSTADSSAMTPQQVAAMANEAQQAQRFGQIAQMGALKYPDYQEKVSAYVQQAQEREQQGDPELSVLMTMAANYGNEDIVHKIATDENFRQEILQSNPKLWPSKLLQSQVSSSPSLQKGEQPILKVAAPPISNMPKTSSYDGLTKMSSSERRLRQKKMSRG